MRQLHPLLSLPHPQPPLLLDKNPPLPHPPQENKSSRMMIHVQLSPPKPFPHPHPQSLERLLLHPQFVADKSLILSASID